MLDSPTAPLEQAYFIYKFGWLAREGWESQPPHQPRINIGGQISTLPYCQPSPGQIQIQTRLKPYTGPRLVILTHTPSWCHIPIHHPGITRHLVSASFLPRFCLPGSFLARFWLVSDVAYTILVLQHTILVYQQAILAMTDKISWPPSTFLHPNPTGLLLIPLASLNP